MPVRAAVVWFGLLLMVVLSGAVRATILEPRVGEQTAHVVGTIFVVVAFLAIISLTIRWVVPSLAPRHLIAIGIGWTAATIAFEFGFGHFVARRTFDELVADYNLARGRLWILVLLTVLLAPVAGGAWFRRGEQGRRTPRGPGKPTR
jgi:hypothetical protein